MLVPLYQILWSGFFFGVTCAIAAIIISPLQFLKIIRQETGKKYNVIFRESYSKYGVSIFFKGAVPYAWTNFFSSMSFGISEYLYHLIYSDVEIFSKGVIGFVWLIFLRAFMGGASETLFSSYAELQEIIRNKKHIMHNPGRFISIIFPILIRNIIFWHAIVISHIIYIWYSLSYFNFTILSFILGVLFGLISLPFDVVATQNCGAKNDMSTFQRFRKIFQDSNIKNQLFFAGTIMRVLQMGILTIVTVFTILLFDYIKLF